MTNRKPLTESHKDTLRRFGWLATCSPDFQAGLLATGFLKKIETGDKLYRKDRVSSHVYGLIEGQINVHLTAPNNEVLVFPFSAPGRWYGLADVIAQQPAFGTAIAGAPSLALCISRQKLLEFLDADPKRYREIIIHEYNLRRGIQETVVDLVTSDGPERVARQLVRMVEIEGTDLSTGLTISQFEFATAAGVSVPSLQRAFRELKRYGAIKTSYGKVVVRDLAVLKEFVQSMST